MTETALYGDVIYRKVGVCVSEKEIGPEDYALIDFEGIAVNFIKRIKKEGMA